MIRIVATGIALFAFALALGIDSRRAGSASNTGVRTDAVPAASPMTARENIVSDRRPTATPALPEAPAVSMRSLSMPTAGAGAASTGVAQSDLPTSATPLAQTSAAPQIALKPQPKPAVAATGAQGAHADMRWAGRERQSEFQREAATAAFAPNEIVHRETLRGGGVGGSGEVVPMQPAGAY